jgi:predicted enzyme related to lactoylglutathione lyase
MDFSGILIGSDDPQRLVDYYTKVLGDPTFADSGYTGWRLGSGWVTVGPHSEVHGKSAHPGRIIWNIETADVRAEFDRMVAAGASVVREPYSMDEGDPGLIATFADPDGNLFQLMSPMGPEMGG